MAAIPVAQLRRRSCSRQGAIVTASPLSLRAAASIAASSRALILLPTVTGVMPFVENT